METFKKKIQMNNPRLLMVSIGFINCVLDIQRRYIPLVQNDSSNVIKLENNLFEQQKRSSLKKQKLYLIEDNRKGHKL